MIGYTDLATRCSGSRSSTECSSTPAPSCGYMFCMAPIQTPSSPVRRSPKYVQVRESGPSGSAGVADSGGTSSSQQYEVGSSSHVCVTTRVVHDRPSARLVSSHVRVSALDAVVTWDDLDEPP